MDRHSSSLNVRLARPDDANAIAKIDVLSWQEAYRNVLPSEYLASRSIEERETVWHASLDRGNPEVWVAEDESSVMGWVAFGECRDETHPVNAGEVWAFYVHPAHWSRGVGRELWLRARSRLLLRGYKAVTVWVLCQNARAIRFYDAAGFSPNTSTIREHMIAGQAVMEVRHELTLEG